MSDLEAALQRGAVHVRRIRQAEAASSVTVHALTGSATRQADCISMPAYPYTVPVPELVPEYARAPCQAAEKAQLTAQTRSTQGLPDRHPYVDV